MPLNPPMRRNGREQADAFYSTIPASECQPNKEIQKSMRSTNDETVYQQRREPEARKDRKKHAIGFGTAASDIPAKCREYCLNRDMGIASSDASHDVVDLYGVSMPCHRPMLAPVRD